MADTDDVGTTVEAVEAKLVVEVVSPSNAGTDPFLKPQLYAAAMIGWYLRVEQPHDSVELHLQRLDGDHYIAVDVARPGQVLASEEPFPFSSKSHPCCAAAAVELERAASCGSTGRIDTPCGRSCHFACLGQGM